MNASVASQSKRRENIVYTGRYSSGLRNQNWKSNYECETSLKQKLYSL